MNKPLIKVIYPQNTMYFDFGIIRQAFAGAFLEMPFEFDEYIYSHEGDYELPESGGAIVVLASRQLNTPEKLDKLKKRLDGLDWCLLLCPGDEEDIFPAHIFKAPNVKVWVGYPNHTKPFLCDRKFVIGWAYDTPALIKQAGGPKPFNERKYLWSFSGQVTHKFRQDMVDMLRARPKGEGYLNISGGFTQGLSRPEYFRLLCDTKIALSPSGPLTPDCFRTWEAIESGAIPVANTTSPDRKQHSQNYWKFMFSEDVPFFQIGDDWSTLNHTIDYYRDNAGELEERIAKTSIWWGDYKRQFAQNLIDDIKELSGL